MDSRPRRRTVSIALAGSGGAGVMTAGNMLLEAAAHAGYYALMTRSSGPQIRGGEAVAMIRIACRPVECMDDDFHVLAAVVCQTVFAAYASTFIEVGPGKVLSGLIRRIEPSARVFSVGNVETVTKFVSEFRTP